MKKLGVGDLVPQLKQRLTERFREVHKGSMIPPEISIPYYNEQVEGMHETFIDEDGFGLDD